MYVHVCILVYELLLVIMHTFLKNRKLTGAAPAASACASGDLLNHHKMADLRDERVLRMTYFNMLFDWDGSDVKKVHEPISHQFGYLLVALLALVSCFIVWRLWNKRRLARKSRPLPYRVVKPPSTVVEKDRDPTRRIVAVMGGTGFVGSWVVDELVSRGEYYVYVLGRTFRPDRTNPNADALIQVDLEDDEGLVNAFQGVDSVIDTAALVPNAFSNEGDTWRLNKQCLEHLVKAAQKARVKNFVFLCGMHMEGRMQDPVARAFVNAFAWGEKFVSLANGENGMRTCVVSPAQIVGLRQKFYEDMISGTITSLPKVKHRASFLSVAYAAKAIVNAEQKLAEGSEKVCGQILPLVGDVMTMEKFTSLPAWPHQIKDTSLYFLTLLAQFNSFCAKWFGWPLFGRELCPAIVMFFDNAEEAVDSSGTCEALDIGPPPKINNYLCKIVQEYNKKTTNNKKKE